MFLEKIKRNEYQDDYIEHFLDYLTQMELLDRDYLDTKVELLEFVLGDV